MKKRFLFYMILALLFIYLLITAIKPKSPDNNEETLAWLKTATSINHILDGNDYTLYGGMIANEENNNIKLDYLLEREVEHKAIYTDFLYMDKNQIGVKEIMRTIGEFHIDGIDDIPNDEKLDFIMNALHLDYNIENELGYGKYLLRIHNNASLKPTLAYNYITTIKYISDGYIAGYLTKDQAISHSVDIAENIQIDFTSWEDLMENYLLQLEIDNGYFLEINLADANNIYKELKSLKDSPYNIDFNTNLIKLESEKE